MVHLDCSSAQLVATQDSNYKAEGAATLQQRSWLTSFWEFRKFLAQDCLHRSIYVEYKSASRENYLTLRSNGKFMQHLSKFDIQQVISGSDFSVEKQNHLAECAHCQTRIDTASADSWWWDDGRELIVSTLKLREEFGAAPKQKGNKGYDPIEAEIKQLIRCLEPAGCPELLGRVGEYDVQSLIGVGGTGAVFKGIDRELNRPVAIKFLLPRHASLDLSRQRFTREARAIAAVNDDNVIQVYRINSNSDYPYFSMPLIEGVSLQQYVCEKGPLDSGELVQISMQIAAGLSAAHKQGLIHRDVKPANVLLESKSNRVIVTDFGLAREESESELTQTGMVAGTPHYMSPEQADGRTIDQRSDQFSLGSVIYFLATGQPPFEGGNQLELLKNIREAETPPVRQHNSTVTVGLEKAIQKLLARNPEHRFQTADEVRDFFEGYLSYLGSPEQNPEPKIGQVKRSTNYIFCSIAIAVTLFAAAGIFFLNRSISRQMLAPTTAILPVSPVVPCDPEQVVVEADESEDLKIEANMDNKNKP